MARALRLFFIVGIFLLLGLTFLSSIRSEPAFILIVALAFAATGMAVALLHDRVAFFSLGLGICVLPVFGAGVLNLFVLAWLGGVYFLRALFGFPYVSIDLSGSREIASWAFFLLILPLLCAVGLTFFLEFDSVLLSTIYRQDGLEGIYALLSSTAIPWHRAMLVASGYIVAGLLFFAVLSVQNVAKNTISLTWGTFAGATIALGFLAGQLLFEGSWFFLNVNPFWHYVGRYPATFSDPNAFGIVSMLLIPLFLGLSSTRRSRVILAIGALLLLVCSVWSGSRTLYLGLGIWIFIVAFSMLRFAKRKELQIALGLGSVLFATSISLIGYPPINESLQRALPFPGTTRVLRTVNWDEAAAMFSSRQIYSRLAYLTWKQNPVTGLGLERFYGEQQRIMRAHDIDLGGWRDNANNFYLQVLVEQGVLGLALLAVAISLFGFAFLSPVRRVVVDVDKIEPASVQRVFSVSRGVLLVFMLSLVTGPHLHFDEVRYLVFFLLAVAVSRPILVESRILKFIRMASVCLVLLFPGLFYASVTAGVERPMSRGFYAMEDSGGVPVAWTGDRARLYFCEPLGEQARLRIRALHPDVESRSVKVALFEREPNASGPLALSEIVPVRKRLDNREWTDVFVPLPKRGMRGVSSIEIRVDRLWSPQKSGTGSDPRWLGVMIQWPKEAC